MVKRKFQDKDETSNKREKKEEIELNNESVSATSTMNYFMNNTLVDWLERYGTNHQYNKQVTSLSLPSFVMSQGNKFEKYIVNKLKEKFSNEEFVEIERNTDVNITRNKTIECIKNKVPIIYQGFLYNKTNNTYGYPDLIVRNDYLCKIIGNVPTTDYIHYVIIDIKFTTLYLKKNSRELLSRDHIPAYKGQLCIYTEALNLLQDIKTQKAYILGRGYNKYGEKEMNPFSLLGEINYENEDTSEKLEKALEWVRILRKEGNSWSVNPPSRYELYPNMKIEDEWHSVKSEIAKNINEITTVWHCGIKHRNIAHENGIYDWKDPKLNTKLMNMKGNIIAPRVDRILNINRIESKLAEDCISYKKFVEVDGWRKDDNDFNCYVDFETFNSMYQICPTEVSSGIYLIGTGYIEDGKWIFKYFILNKNTLEDQKNLIISWLNWLYEKSNNKKIKLYHYSSAEPICFRQAIMKFNIVYENIEWRDLYKVVYNNCLTVKGCLNFSLKGIIKGLTSIGLLNIKYDDLNITNGSGAMIAFFNAVKQSEEFNTPLSEIQCMKDSILYNEKDCESLYLLLDVLEELIL